MSEIVLRREVGKRQMKRYRKQEQPASEDFMFTYTASPSSTGAYISLVCVLSVSLISTALCGVRERVKAEASKVGLEDIVTGSGWSHSSIFTRCDNRSRRFLTTTRATMTSSAASIAMANGAPDVPVWSCLHGSESESR